MWKGLRILALLPVAVMAGPLTAQTPSALQLAPLCDLQTKVPQGEHQIVQVQGVYLSGLEGQYLVTSDCSGRSTSIEFKLRSRRLWRRLVSMTNRTDTQKNVVLVIFEGEFYGPPVPDPNLPEAFRRNYHPGWDHMNASMTKLVVRAIKRVRPLPPDHPCAPPKSDPHQWQCWQGGQIP